MNTYTRTTSVKFRGKEVRNPVLRKLTVLMIIVLFCIFGPILLALSPILFVVHVLLRLFGRKGFVRKTYTRNSSSYSIEMSYSIEISADAFRRTA